MKIVDRDYVINHIKGYIKANIAFILVLISIFVGCSYKILKDGYNELTLIPIIALVFVGLSTLYGIVMNIIAIKLSSNMLKDFENFAYQKNIYTVTRVVYTGSKNNSKRFRADYIDSSYLSNVPDGVDLPSLAAYIDNTSLSVSNMRGGFNASNGSGSSSLADFVENTNLLVSNMRSGFVDVTDGIDLNSLAGTNLVCLEFGDSDKAGKLCFLEACNDIQL